MPGCRAEPAVAAALAQSRGGRRLAAPAAPVLLVFPAAGGALLRDGRGDGRVQRRIRQRRGQRRLDLVRVQQGRQPLQRRCRRRHQRTGLRAAAAPVPGENLLTPPGRGLRDRQRPRAPARHPRHQH